MEEENNNLNENNCNLIKFKIDNALAIQSKQMNNYNQNFGYQPKINLNTGYNMEDEQISSMVDKIMEEKKEKNIYDFLKNEIIKKNIDNYENNIFNNNDTKNIKGINHEIEQKVNKILAGKKKKV